MNLYEYLRVLKIRKIREFLRILNTEVTNSQTMGQTQTWSTAYALAYRAIV